jgi:hypothetical protein
MSQNQDLKRLAKKTYMSYHQDGLVDLLIGWMIIAFAAMMAFDQFTFLGWLPITLYVPLKKRITAPRFGYVKFDSEHGGQGRMVTAFLIMGLLSFFVLGILFFLVTGESPPSFVQWIREYTILFYGLVGAISFMMSGLITGIRRFYAYMLLSLFLTITGQILETREFLPILLLGVGILISGIIHLVRFTRKYPNAEGDIYGS